ncbi:DUF3203 family protein [Pseudomonas lundensis]|uniref:DUF3203 family protein n=1 Tax=Pseudomonas lundensis TaxID=86185 RepID=UPI000BA1E198|nr:DUF3203 family protein [Pseudomonas lundensis]OZY31759.1 hypothetical protein CJF36_15110 [Pseudomonas lundensis]OZY50508.1 hypothetical protein CJF34_11945 [Pseudomonas lundensis]
MSFVIDRNRGICVFSRSEGELQVQLPKIIVMNNNPSGLSEARVGHARIAITEEEAETLVGAGAVDQRTMRHATSKGSPI